MDRTLRQEALAPNKLATLWSTLLNRCRRSSITARLLPPIRVARQLIHFGPWRIIPRFLIRRLRPAAAEHQPLTDSLLPHLDPVAVANEIRHNSVAVAGVLPPDFVSRLRAITDKLPIGDYQVMHSIDDDIRSLTDDPKIKATLRAYLQCEPVLLESTLVITKPHGGGPLSEQNYFHFDYAGWDSLNIFVYLSDMDSEASCHVIARGSHRDIRVRDILRGHLDDDEALQRFGNSIETITGPAGTLFFENTEAFHRRYPGNERRVMLNLLFASHRNLLSHGRTSRQHMQRRKQAYERKREAAAN